MKKLGPIMLFVVPLILGGCGQQQKAVITTSKAVQWASLPTSEQQAIAEVSKHFGDANPKVLKIAQDVTEADQKPMYLVRLSGHFIDGKIKSNDLSFSILADGTEAWAITNQSGSIPDTELSLR